MKYNHVLNDIFDFFLPRFCLSCNKKLSAADKILCDECFSLLKFVPKNLLESEFQRKFQEEKVISDFASLFAFESDGVLQKVIHELKYNQKFSIGVYLGELIGEYLKEQINQNNIEIILPVPIHKLKKAERGYNQSYYISKGISKRLNIPVQQNLLKRIRYTDSQTNLGIEERKKNVINAFKSNKHNKIAGKSILLVDDVITTGATITECGRELLNAGAKKICAVSVGLAQ
ncbi:ComF family protein [Melioribacteraceae bacterium 4301-Me]|uniref:ComF family protein n=1 Tax=Pyranulibacter aquaticus TaxID=3163344 RepID=UPI0035983DC7